MPAVYTAIRYYLVEHSIVSQFEWVEGKTWGASPLFLAASILAYLCLTLSLCHFPLPSLHPAFLRFVSAVHSLSLSLLSLIMAVGCSLSTLAQMPDRRWIFCFPTDRTPTRGPVFFWAHAFYLSKLLEFGDTLLIVLSGTRRRRLSFLHVYHHALVLAMCYVWLRTSQSLMPVALVTNASVHVLMYAYYLLSALGVRPWWKRLVTDCQIVQFVFSFLVSGLMLYYHFTGTGCSGIYGWCFNAVFNASLLALFVDFHSKNYERRKNNNGGGEVKDKGS